MAKLTTLRQVCYKLSAAIILCFSLLPQAMAASDTRLDGIEVIANKNQLPLLDNRFRIDHNVKEITLLFFRKSGTAPVILVRPDGSEMYATMAVTGEADWFDEKTYDLIRIKKPMPGPWQAVGELSEGSRVLIITDFELNVDDLPEILIQGETIKLTGYVTNRGEPIRAKNFKDVITLDVDFVSTNDERYSNFGAGVQQVTSFVDDGKGFDENPRDGVFTGEFLLDFAPGAWIPQYHIQTPLMKRVLEHDEVIVHPNPVKMSIETTDKAEGFHQFKIELEGDYIKKDTLIFQGKVHYPNQEIQSFAITDNLEGPRIFNVINYDFGLYRITMSAFGENANGREFMLKIPEFSFSIDPPPVEETGEPGVKFDVDGNPILNNTQVEVAQEPEPEPVDNTLTIVLIVLGNLLLALIAWLAVRIFVHDKKPSFNFKLPKISFRRKKKEADDGDGDENAKRDKKPSEDDDILDLSLPDS